MTLGFQLTSDHMILHSEECNMSYLLHVEDDGHSDGDIGNSIHRGKIDVDYDALEASASI